MDAAATAGGGWRDGGADRGLRVDAAAECGVQKMRDEHSDHTLHVFVYDGGISRANSFCW